MVHVNVSSNGFYDVMCVECGEFIGAFRSDAMLSMEMITRSKGGVKCVICRSFSCSNCGVTIKQQRGLGEVSFCTLCQIIWDDCGLDESEFFRIEAEICRPYMFASPRKIATALSSTPNVNRNDKQPAVMMASRADGDE